MGTRIISRGVFSQFWFSFALEWFWRIHACRAMASLPMFFCDVFGHIALRWASRCSACGLSIGGDPGGMRRAHNLSALLLLLVLWSLRTPAVAVAGSHKKADSLRVAPRQRMLRHEQALELHLSLTHVYIRSIVLPPTYTCGSSHPFLCTASSLLPDCPLE